MKNISKKLTKKLGSKKGQGTVEYILIVALLVGAVMLFGGKFKEGIGKAVGSMFGGVTNAIGNLTK